MGNVFSVTEVILNSTPKPGLSQSGGEVCSKCLSVNTGLRCGVKPLRALPEALQTCRWILLVTDRKAWKRGLIGGSGHWALLSLLPAGGEVRGSVHAPKSVFQPQAQSNGQLTQDYSLGDSKPSCPSVVSGTEGTKQVNLKTDCPVGIEQEKKKKCREAQQAGDQGK